MPTFPLVRCLEAFCRRDTRILLATTSNWFSTARLAMALSHAGCVVKAVCRIGHPLEKTQAARRTYGYNALAPLASFRDAILASTPDLIVPSDDLAVRHLHELYKREKKQGKAGTLICALIERSLGPAENFPIIYQRTGVLELAREEGIRVPKMAVLENEYDLTKWIEQTSFPTVLKSDGTSGGGGVRIVETPEEARSAFRFLQSPPSIVLAAKRAIADQDFTLVLPILLRRSRVVNAQTFVAGREATSLVFCWEGEVLAGLHFEVLCKQDSTGPASVLRLVEDSEMSQASEKMARRLRLSGFHGFDFMRDAETGKTHLIELNPRATQVGHLALGPGRDLPAALYSAMTGQVLQESPKVTEKDVIALFPQEWTRNPESTFFGSAYHDVPWEEPELIRACVRRRWKWGAWYRRRKRMQAFSMARRLGI